MTTIVVVKKDGQVVIAGDTLTTFGSTRLASVHDAAPEKLLKHGATYFLMGRNGNKNGFRATAAAVSSMFVELPRSKSHSHAHPEAYLYALKGNGYSEIGGRNFVWEQGDAVHVPPGMMHHQHFNPTDDETRELRFEFGVRYWFTEQWDGFQTIDRHLRPTPLDE